MPLVPYALDRRDNEDVMIAKGGSGYVTRYHGSAFQNDASFFSQNLKNLFAKIANFSRPILRAAVTHAKVAFDAAKPHLGEAATGIAKETSK